MPILKTGGSGQYTTIQAAINAARDGDTVLVAQGTYKENITIISPKNIRVQGGWTPDFASRNGDNALTQIDGDRRGGVFDIQAGPLVTTTIVIEGMTIKNGLAKEGGGIRAVTASKLTLHLINDTITGNISSERGGCVYLGAFYGGNLVATLTNNSIEENAVANEGGGIRIVGDFGGSALVTLEGNVIRGNSSNYDGGGIAAYATNSGTATLTLENNLITGNTSEGGGGVLGYAYSSDAQLVIRMNNNVIANNTAKYGSGVFSISGVTEPMFSKPGGSVFMELTNNTITGNVSSEADCIQLHSGSIYGDGGLNNLSMENTIVWGNTDPHRGLQIGVVVEPGKAGVATANVSYSDIGSIGTWGTGTYTVDHVINQDPRFVDFANRSFFLRDDSPAIDAGDPDPVYNDGKRPPGKGTERGDMGAYGGPNNGNWPSIR